MKSSYRRHIEHDSISIGEKALEALLLATRKGIVGRKQCEENMLKKDLAAMRQLWDERFPVLPNEPSSYASFWAVSRRGLRDRYLKSVIVDLLDNDGDDDRTIINPVCVWGRHARDLARRLPKYGVLATDIRAEWDRVYSHIPYVQTPENYHFQRNDIFEPTRQANPKAVVFFGACGELTDAAMDYAIESNSPYLICRTCCHENIGGNTDIVKHFTLLNLLFRLKNLAFSQARKQDRGEYFSHRYSAHQYPRSETARRLSSSEEFIGIARRSVDSDTARTIIDLDRYLHLAEAGYSVWYRAEMFVAQKRQELASIRPT